MPSVRKPPVGINSDTKFMPIAATRNGVAFVVDRVMHYHVPTMKAIESGLAEKGIPFYLLSAQDKAEAVGRVAISGKVVSGHQHFRLTEKNIGSFSIRFQHELLRACSEIDPAVVVTTCHSGTLSEWLLLLWARRRSIRRVAWQCGYEYNPASLKAAVLRRFIPLFDFHLCYHTNAQRYALCYGAERGQTLVMHNTVDESRITAGDKSIAKAKVISHWPALRGKRLVLYVGAVLEEKRLELVFDALDLLALPDVAFLLVGDGPYLQTLKQRYNGRTDWISTGSIIDRVGDIFDAADVFVLPGTGGLAINEAMAHRTAVISSYADGSADDLVADGVTGFRLRSDSVEEMARLLRELLGNPQRAMDMGAEGEKLIRGKLSFRSFIDRVVTTLADQHEKACANT